MKTKAYIGILYKKIVFKNKIYLFSYNLYAYIECSERICIHLHIVTSRTTTGWSRKRKPNDDYRVVSKTKTKTERGFETLISCV